MNLNNTKSGFLWTLVLLIGIGGSLLLPDGAYGAKAGSQKEQALVKEIIRLSGIGKFQAMAQKHVPPEVFEDSSVLGTLEMPTEQIALISNLYTKGFQGSDFYNAKQNYIMNHYDNEAAKAALAWFRSPSGRRATQMEREYAQTIGNFQTLISEISANLPTKRRLAIIDRIEIARSKTGFDKKVRISMLRTVDPLGKRLQSPPTEALVEKVEKDLHDQIRTNNLLYFLYVYQKLKNEDLIGLANFYESAAGHWFNEVDLNGSLKGLDTTNANVKKQVGIILLAIDSGRENVDMIKEVFPPGLRFLIAKRQPPATKRDPEFRRIKLALKRDPFVPLIVAEIISVEEAVKLTKFGGELDILPIIPFELYEKIKEMDLDLYEDLEKYGALFRDKKDLDALSDDDYLDEIDNYKNLIDKANGMVSEFIITPLQVDFDAFGLKGFIWTGDLNLALMETSDGKGHLVRVGSYLGPNFGVVESIDSEHILVVERERDYKGDIITNQVDIKFTEPEE